MAAMSENTNSRHLYVVYLPWYCAQVRVRVATIKIQLLTVHNAESVYILVSVRFVVIKIIVTVHLRPVTNTIHAPNIVAKLSIVFKHP